MFRRPHPDPHDASSFDHRIGRHRPALGQLATVFLGGNIDALAIHIEFPAVIDAAQSTLLVAPEIQLGAPMRAVRIEHADAVVAVSERHQVFPQEANTNRGTVGARQFTR